MTEQVKKIVAELCRIEPLFVGREKELEPIVQRLLEAKPVSKIDQRFVQQLKRQLLAIAGSQLASHSINKFKIKFMNKIQFGVLGALAVIILVFVVYTSSNSGGSIVVRNNDYGKPSISTLASAAFGKITLPDGGLSAPNPAAAEGKAMGFGGGGGGAGASDVGMTVPAYDEITLFKYIYKGELASLDDESMAVYKRVAGNLSNSVNGIIKNLGLGLINTKVFSNAKVRSVQFVDKSGEDWNVYVDFDQGFINLYREVFYNDQPQPYQPITQDQLLPDDQLISLADAAIKKFGIDVQAFGEPVVMDDWRLYYELAADKANYYFPEYMNVVYPQMIKGQQAVEQSGYAEGISVTVDIRRKEVNSINNISVQTFQASDYSIENDINTLVNNFTARTQSWGYPTDLPVKYVDVELGTPKFVMAKIYRWENNISEQLYVPALMFPVTTQLADYPYMNKQVVIPLVEDIYTYY